MASLHTSPFAGSWYPDDPAELGRLIDGLLEASERRTGLGIPPGPLALLVPHAGLKYSGTVAAAAYRALAAARPSRIVLMGFSHRGGPSGVAIPDVDRIATPAGEVEVDRAAASALAAPPFEIVPERALCDHSVEIQIPLLQRAVPGVPVLPLYVGSLEPAERDEAAHALLSLMGPGTVFLASSDLTHYGRSFGFLPFPPDDRAQDRLHQLDHDVLDAAGSIDADLFLDHLAESGSTMCGYMPAALLLRTLSLVEGGEVYQYLYDYQTSADITGDVQHSVSYGAAGYYRAASFQLCPEDQELLLASARETLAKLLDTGQRQPVPPARITPALTRAGGVFVTLHEGGDLRGCVGNRSGAAPLAEAVPDLTLAAALDDTRFRPMRHARGPVEMEISVLTPMRRVRNGRGFRLGRHGAYVESGPRRGLLLPQVARNRDWTPEQFLGALAHKAGLTQDAWSRPDTRLSVFEAQLFSTTLTASA